MFNSDAGKLGLAYVTLSSLGVTSVYSSSVATATDRGIINILSDNIMVPLIAVPAVVFGAILITWKVAGQKSNMDKWQRQIRQHGNLLRAMLRMAIATKDSVDANKDAIITALSKVLSAEDITALKQVFSRTNHDISDEIKDLLLQDEKD
jgi:hypothetical protein